MSDSDRAADPPAPPPGGPPDPPPPRSPDVPRDPVPCALCGRPVTEPGEHQGVVAHAECLAAALYLRRGGRNGSGIVPA